MIPCPLKWHQWRLASQILYPILSAHQQFPVHLEATTWHLESTAYARDHNSSSTPAVIYTRLVRTQYYGQFILNRVIPGTCTLQSHSLRATYSGVWSIIQWSESLATYTELVQVCYRTPMLQKCCPKSLFYSLRSFLWREKQNTCIWKSIGF